MYPIKISVIIVVYNVENYLRQCLDSVVNQTLKEIEIICVNDGSTDNSLQILEEYAKKDDRIMVISKEIEIIKRNFIKMNPFCIANLNSSNTVEYQFIINSDTYREFELRKRISNLEEEIETLKKEYQIEINYKKQLIHEITSSNSWKLTKPLRKFRNVLKRNQ